MMLVWVARCLVVRMRFRVPRAAGVRKGLGHTVMSTTSMPSVAPAARRIPLWLKLTYTTFMAVLVPVYLRNYGPTNFPYFCDVALIITLVGIWIESPLLVSMCAVGID
jgi:hypothetical protein